MDDTALLIARTRLGQFVLGRAKGVGGPGYRATEFGISSWPDLKVQWRLSMLNNEPLPVWSGGSDKTVYLTPEINHAGRYWHDATHIRLQADFSLAGELKVAAAQIELASMWFGPGSLEVLLLTADTVGQALHYAKSGMFVEDQLAFAKAFIEQS